MSAKTSERRRRAFFAALAATGNQTLAAERAKVSRSWMTLHRSTDPDFKAAMDAAIAVAKERLRAAETVRPGADWRAQDGEELVVRGSNGRRTQIARARVKQWTPRLEARFLSALAASCNVKAACAQIGLTVASVYGHYHRWPAFARLWDDALETGYLRLEGALIENACNLFSPRGVEPDATMPAMTVEQAIQLWVLHNRRVNRTGGPRVGGPEREASMDEVRAHVLKKVEILMRIQAREQDDPARDSARAAFSRNFDGLTGLSRDDG